MERRDLTELLSRETVLRLTEEAFGKPPEEEQRPAEKMFNRQEKNEKIRKFPRWAALAACLALVVMAANFDTVYAAVRELMYFLPGKGTVSEASFPDYWIPTEEYAAHTQEADYFVTYLYRWGDTLSLRVKKEIFDCVMPSEPEEQARIALGDPYTAGDEAPTAIADMISLVIKDEDGIPITFFGDSHRGVFAVYSEDQAKLDVEWEFTGCTLERFILELDGVVEFPVELRKIAADDYAVAGGTTVRDAGYAMTLLPLNRSCSRFALLTTPDDEAEGNTPEEGSYWSPLTFDLVAVGESGKEYKAQPVSSRPECQEFYLPELPEEKITHITVTGILESTRYEKKRPELRLPALEPGEEVTLDAEVKLWNDTLTAEAAGLTGEGEFWVRFRYDGEGRRLNQIDLEWPHGSRFPSQRTTMGEDGRYTTAALEMEQQAGKKTTLPVSFVSVVQEGKWEFSVVGD